MDTVLALLIIIAMFMVGLIALIVTLLWMLYAPKKKDKNDD